MVSIWELNNQISTYHMQIEECKRKIEEDNRKIEELTTLKGRIGAMEEHLWDAQSARKAKLFQTTVALDEAMRYSKKIIKSYDARMNDLLAGSEYAQTVNGLENASEEVSSEQRRLRNEIDSLWNEITSLEQAICRCEAEIAEIERQERERREREEWEARMAYEASVRGDR